MTRLSDRPAFLGRSEVLVAVIPGRFPLIHSEGLRDVRLLGGRPVATGDECAGDVMLSQGLAHG